MVTAAKAAFEFHSPNKSFPVCENEVQQSTSSHRLLCQLDQEVITDALQEPPELLMPCCVVPPADVGVVEVHHEDHGPQT